ncbi:MAG: alpha/beta hydrolase [Nitrospira sp.]|nr:alpha/beta hydrolase [Nitrospira sp.]MBS0173882.1 alpha/beta hydrolase [Nitrospira sp.]MCW5779667.1 alpha/beta hydrolase [Nitrospira sp.]
MPKHELSMDGVTALIVPGIGNSGPRHWQTLWEQNHPRWQRVQQRDWDHPVLDEWLRGLDVAMAGWPQPPVLIAHSMGCLLVAHWARRASAAVGAALLVAPPDPQGPAFPSTARGFETVPSDRLPFPSLVVASSNDAFGSVDYAKQCAVDWGSAFVEAGAIGHINAESDLGAWPAGFVFLTQLLATS